MSSNHRKRKHRPTHPSRHRDRELSQQQEQFLGHHQSYLDQAQASTSPASELAREFNRDPLQALYIQAHEADIIRGPKALLAAQSLEVAEYQTSREVDENGGEHEVVTGIVPRIGSALIQWGDNAAHAASTGTMRGFAQDYEEDDETIPTVKTDSDKASIWVDRYDARLLLEALPIYDTTTSGPGPSSPTGWSDLSSEAEDTFFFRPDEVDEFHKEKRRRLLEQTREDRLKARMEEDGEEETPKEEEDIWGSSDEEPDDAQNELMKRTAIHLLSSPNAAQLEMRILANHGGDRRFAFLRGRWSRAWKLAKAKARLEKEKEKAEKETAQKSSTGLGILEGYGSDSEAGDGDGDGQTKDGLDIADVEPSTGSDQQVGEELAKEARRQRLKEWAEKRRATKDDRK
ncbi:hypothetical protein GALMADRAFT_281148 [Galerina marginata CBS 339.88]|uniref:Suppressor of white apricot N-terminal domain-containing protein n=1 Tax=Galerina marginata (strain CBS 339.88) TaxID=685588 RepID=A0A067SS92_GALM3|nr:hypothetical protein GALMADRAFT_281148 [Galerina marginata CBS 339.88]